MRQALILAGSRPGPDPLAAAEGVAHKALIEIDGRTMLARVAAALARAGYERIMVSTGPGAVADAATALGLQTIPARPGPSQSVAAAVETLGTPLLVTTADHALLEPDWVNAFVQAVPERADVAVLLARRERIEHELPGSQRTYLRFADGDWSGCNLFYLATARARGAIDLWAEIEADRKRPWRIVRRLGVLQLLRYLLGRLTLQGAIAHLGRRASLEAAAVESAFGLAAVDVDKVSDLSAVRNLTQRTVVSGALLRPVGTRSRSAGGDMDDRLSPADANAALCRHDAETRLKNECDRREP